MRERRLDAAAAGLSLQPARGAYRTKVSLLSLFCLADLVINSFADHNEYPGHGSWFPLVLMGVQFVVQIFNMLLVFMLFFGTYLFQVRCGSAASPQVGLTSLLFREFRALTYVLPLQLVVFIVYAAVKVVRGAGAQTAQSLLLGDGLSRIALWDSSAFIFVHVLHKLATLVYYAVLAHGALRLGESQWYLRAPWVKLYRGQNAEEASQA